MKVFKIINRLFVFIVIISLISLVFGFYYDLNHVKGFKQRWIIEEKAGFDVLNAPRLDSILHNKTKDPTIINPEMQKAVDISNGIIPIIILFWAWLIRKDLIDLYNSIKEKIK